MKVSRENDLERLQHMLDAAQKALSYGTGLTFEDLKRDELRVLALARLLEIIGEAASKISSETQVKYTRIPWVQMVGMRNHLIHGYFNVDLNIIWETLNNNLPSLIQSLEEIIADIQNQND